MKAWVRWALVAVVGFNGVRFAQPAEMKHAGADSAERASFKEKLVGAWRLASMEERDPDGKITRITGRKGMLIYTHDGHMSVQLMLPESESDVSNDYVRNGYEASFGSYDVNEEERTVTHHVEGSVTRGLVGKNLPRAFQLTNDGRLIIKSTRPDERWSVTWERY